MSNLEKRARIAAIRWHGDQKRKYTFEPYVHHPIAVAALVKEVPHTEEMIAAALLHDTREDCGVTDNMIRAEFGHEVANLVGWLTDISKSSDGNREIRKALDREHLAEAPREAKTVKLADLIDNSKSITKYDPDFARVYLAEKRLLLDEALREGDPYLWAMADEIVRKHL